MSDTNPHSAPLEAINAALTPNTPRVSFQRLKALGILPTRGTPRAAGLDLYAAEAISLGPGTFHAVTTGFNVEIPEGYEGQVRARSGNAIKYGIGVVNSPGTIDDDYRGELKVILINHGPSVFDVKVGDRIGQLVIAKCELFPAVEVAELSSSATRGAAGFGSTGR